MTFHPYVAAFPPCSGRPLPGTANLQQAVLDRYDRALDFGIYNCRPSTGDPTVPSIHSDGRAGDVGFPVVDGGHPQGWALVSALRVHAEELGIMGIIYYGIRWSARNPAGAVYTGPHFHADHVHYEQEPNLAITLTLDDAFRLIGGTVLTPSQEKLVADLEAIITEEKSNVDVFRVLFKLIRFMRKVDDLHDATDI